MKPNLGVFLVALLVGIAGTLLWKHDADARRDGQIVMLDSARAQDAIALAASQRHSDSLAKSLYVATHKADSAVVVWDTVTRQVTDTVQQIIHDTTLTDTQKLPKLLQQITRLQATGDSLAGATRVLTKRIVEDSSARVTERAASTKALHDASAEIALLKKQSRHWGLGAAAGYGVAQVHLPDGSKVVQAAPVLNLGFVYRF